MRIFSTKRVPFLFDFAPLLINCYLLLSTYYFIILLALHFGRVYIIVETNPIQYFHPKIFKKYCLTLMPPARRCCKTGRATAPAPPFPASLLTGCIAIQRRHKNFFGQSVKAVLFNFFLVRPKC